MKKWYLVNTTMVSDMTYKGKPIGNGEGDVLAIIYSDVKPDAKEEMKKLGYKHATPLTTSPWVKDGEYDVPFYAPEIHEAL